jgi:oxygen-independent coproporphyrinogen III oxidase
MIRHVYVHIPFCHRICPYCSFFKHEPGSVDQVGFLDALTIEAQRAREHWGERLAPETLYFGGGTPSLLSTVHLERWLPTFLRALGRESLREWTMEINPMTIDARKAALLRELGLTRASLGVQAWDEGTLQTLGRDHSPARAREAFTVLREAGLSQISIDLMFSVPGQSLAQWQASLRETVALSPDHISAYNLTYEEDTAFFERFRRGEYHRDEATDEAFFASAIDLLGDGGYGQYEVSNYARPGCQSQHNQSYWAGAAYLGLGPSAVSTVDRRRWKNVADTPRYVDAIRRGQPLTDPAADEILTEAQWACERIALELRTTRGVAREFLPEPAKLEALLADGLAEVRGERLILTKKGLFVVDSVAEYLWIC